MTRQLAMRAQLALEATSKAACRGPPGPGGRRASARAGSDPIGGSVSRDDRPGGRNDAVSRCSRRVDRRRLTVGVG